MTRTYRVLAVVACLLIAGCVGSPGLSQSSTTSQSVTTTTKYPELPESRSNASLINFAKSYERATATDWARETASGEIQELAISINNVTVVERSVNGTLVHVEYRVGMRVESASGAVSSSDTQFTANYYVTEDHVYRASTKGLRRPGPDPRKNGTVLPPRPTATE